MGERLETSYLQRQVALKRIGLNIRPVSDEIVKHLFETHQVSPGYNDYMDLFGSHMVDESNNFPEPIHITIYDSAARNRGAARARRARNGQRRWMKDVTGL